MKTFLIAAALAVSVAACGTDTPAKSGAATPPKQSEIRKAMLAFASCMREHGVDMPDPKFDGGRVTMSAGGPSTNQDTMRAADKACAKYREAVKPPELSDDKKAEFKQAALANARCMRERGIDFPDPTFDSSGGAQIHLDRGKLNPEDPKFKSAMKACEKTMPGGGQTDVAEGGEK